MDLMITAIAVDDNPIQLRELCSIIHSFDLGIEITGTFCDGQSALDSIAELHPDIVFADIMMPVMNGLELAKNLKKNFPDIKIIFVSSSDDFNTAKSAINLNINEYILKPLKIPEVQKAVTNVIDTIRKETEKNDELNILIEKINESKPIYIEQLFVDLLFSKIAEHTLSQRLALLDLSYLENKCVAVSLIHVNLKNTDIVADYHTSLSVKNFISGYTFNKLENFYSQYSITEFVIINFFEPNEKSFYKNLLYDFYAEISNSISGLFDVSINISFSSISESILEINNLFKQANKAMSSIFFKTNDPIIAFEDIPDTDYMDKNIDFTELFNDVTNVVYSSDEEINSFIKKYFENISIDNKYIQEYTKSLMYFIISILESILIKEHKSFEDIFEENLVVWKKLSNFESISDYKNWIKNIFAYIKQSLKQDDVADETFVSKIKNYIHENYKENIILSDIADSVFYSVRQANYIFKNKTGITIYDYLIEYRLEMAKQLLADAGYPDGFDMQIAQMTDSPQTLAMNEIFQAMMAQIGVRVEIVQMDSASYYGQRAEGTLPSVNNSWSADFNDPDNFLYTFFSEKSSLLRSSNYKNTDIQQRLEAARAMTDPEARIAEYKAIEETIINTDAMMIPLYSINHPFLISERVKNFKVSWNGWNAQSFYPIELVG